MWDNFFEAGGFGMYPTLIILAAPGAATIWQATSERWRDLLGGRSLRTLIRTFGTSEP